jgi:hypothetical protein
VKVFKFQETSREGEVSEMVYAKFVAGFQRIRKPLFSPVFAVTDAILVKVSEEILMSIKGEVIVT